MFSNLMPQVIMFCLLCFFCSWLSKSFILKFSETFKLLLWLTSYLVSSKQLSLTCCGSAAHKKWTRTVNLETLLVHVPLAHGWNRPIDSKGSYQPHLTFSQTLRTSYMCGGKQTFFVLCFQLCPIAPIFDSSKNLLGGGFGFFRIYLHVALFILLKTVTYFIFPADESKNTQHDSAIIMFSYRDGVFSATSRQLILRWGLL